MGSTMHWCTHNDKMNFVMEMFEFQQFLMLDLKQINNVPLIKIFEFVLSWYRDF